MREMFTLPWKLPVWKYLDYTEFGLFVATSAKTSNLTASYWLVPGTGY